MAPPAPELAPFLKLWDLEFVAVAAHPSGREAYPGTGAVAFVRRGGDELVLKLAPAGTDEALAGDVLSHWDGVGAVRLVAQHRSASGGAVLIERLRPGGDLCDLALGGRDDEATAVLCGVMRQLTRPAPPAGAYRRIEDWGAGFSRNRKRALALGVEAALLDRAEGLFFELCATQAAPVLLHGDLQHFNVLWDESRGWLAIDPKGVLGEPAYETGAMLRNPNIDPDFCASPARLDRRARIVAEELGYSYARIIGWAFSQWVLAVLWAIEDNLPFQADWLAGAQAAEALL